MEENKSSLVKGQYGELYIKHERPGLNYIYDAKTGDLLWIENYELPEIDWDEGEQSDNQIT